jgi:hypothetical protein
MIPVHMPSTVSNSAAAPKPLTGRVILLVLLAVGLGFFW